MLAEVISDHISFPVNKSLIKVMKFLSVDLTSLNSNKLKSVFIGVGITDEMVLLYLTRDLSKGIFA